MVVIVVLAVGGSAPAPVPMVVHWVGKGQLGVGLICDPSLQVPVAPHALPDADPVEDAGQGKHDDHTPVDDDACGAYQVWSLSSLKVSRQV